MSRVGKFAFLLVAGILSSCRDAASLRELSGPIRLGSAPIVLRPEPALRVTAGATQELCLVFADSVAREAFCSTGSIEQATGSPMRTREGQIVRVTATFTAENGTVESVVPTGWVLAKPVTRV